MSSKSRLDFILQITHYFGGRWEDPNWGKDTLGQILIMTAIHELASKISDTKVRSEIQNSAVRSISQTAQNI